MEDLKELLLRSKIFEGDTDQKNEDNNNEEKPEQRPSKN